MVLKAVAAAAKPAGELGESSIEIRTPAIKNNPIFRGGNVKMP